MTCLRCNTEVDPAEVQVIGRFVSHRNPAHCVAAVRTEAQALVEEYLMRACTAEVLLTRLMQFAREMRPTVASQGVYGFGI